VYFHHGGFDSGNRIVNGDGGMGVSSCIQNNAIIGKANFLQGVNNFTFYVRLKIISEVEGKRLFNFSK